MRLIPVHIISSNIPVSAPLRTYISEKLGCVARSGSDVLGIGVRLRSNRSASAGRYTASGLIFLAGRRIYCSACAPGLVSAIDRLSVQFSRLARERQPRASEVVEPVPAETISEVLCAIDAEVDGILLPQPVAETKRRADRSPARHRQPQAVPTRPQRLAMPASCA